MSHMTRGSNLSLAERVSPHFGTSGPVGPPLALDFERALVFWSAFRDRPRARLAGRHRIAFLSRLGYPVWIVPTEGKGLFLDGLGLHSVTFQEPVSPPLETITEAIGAAHESRSGFANAVQLWIDVLSPVAVAQAEIRTAFPHDLAATVLKLLMDVPDEKAMPVDSCLVPFEMRQETLEAGLRGYEDAKRRSEAHLQRYRSVLRQLDAEADHHGGRVREHALGLEHEFEAQLQATRALVTQRIEELRSKQAVELDSILARYEERKEFFRSYIDENRKLLLSLRRDREILMRILADITSHDSLSRLWKHLLTRFPARIRDTEREITHAQTVLGALEEQMEREAGRVKGAYADLIQARQKALRDLEVEREVEVSRLQEEWIEVMKDVAKMRHRLVAWIEQAERTDRELEALLVGHVTGERPALALIPMYVVCYESASGDRKYRIRPPSILQPPSPASPRKWKSTVMRELLKPHSQALEELALALSTRVDSDPTLERVIFEAGKRGNLLADVDARRGIEAGLHELEGREWLFHGEVRELLGALAQGP